jgi:hypothetical protein
MEGYDINKIKFKSKNEPSVEEKLTGKVITGLKDLKEVQPNAELEGKEYMQFPDGTTQLVVGNSHKKDGVKMNIPDGTKIVSHALKLSAKEAKDLKEEYGINVSNKDSYSSAITKYTKKIGLDALYDEEKELYELVNKQSEKSDVKESTRLVNEEYMSGKTREIQLAKEDKEVEKAQFFGVVYDLQEASKSEGKKKKSEDGEMKYGGLSKQDFKAVCKKHGISEDQGRVLMGEMTPSFEVGGEFDELKKKYNTTLKINTAFEDGKVTQQQYNKLMTDIREVVEGVDYDKPAGAGVRGSAPYEEGEAYTPAGVKRLNSFRKKYELEEISSDSSKEEIKKAAGELQNHMAENYPELVYDYMVTKSHQPNRKLGEFLSGKKYENSNEGLAKALKDKAITKKDVVEKYQDDLWWYRALDFDEKTIPRSEYDLLIEREGAIKQGDDLYFAEDPDNPEHYTKYVPTDNEEEVTKDVVPPGIIDDTPPNLPKKNFPQLFGAPNEYPTPPAPMDPHLMGESRFQRMDPIRIGIEPQIQEAADQRKFMSEQMFGNLSPEVAASVMANSLASQTGAINTEARTANMTNAQNLANTKLFNIGQAGKESEANRKNKLSFEQRQYTAKANYQEEMKRWEDQIRRININKYKNNSALNLMNQMFPDFDVNAGANNVSFNPQSEWYIKNKENLLAAGIADPFV